MEIITGIFASIIAGILGLVFSYLSARKAKLRRQDLAITRAELRTELDATHQELVNKINIALKDLPEVAREKYIKYLLNRRLSLQKN